MQGRQTTDFVRAIDEVNADVSHLLKRPAFFQDDPADYIRHQFQELETANLALQTAMNEMEKARPVFNYADFQAETLLALDKTITTMENDLTKLDTRFNNESQALLQRSIELIEELQLARRKRVRTPPKHFEVATKVTHHLRERAQEIEEKQPVKNPTIKPNPLRSVSTQRRDSQLVAINQFIEQVVDQSAKEMVDENVASCIKKLDAVRAEILSASEGYLEQHRQLIKHIREQKAKKVEILLAREFAISENNARVSHKVMRLLLRVYHLFASLKATFAAFFCDQKRQRASSVSPLLQLDERLHAAEIKLQAQMKNIWCYADDDDSFEAAKPSVNAEDIYIVASSVEKAEGLTEADLKQVLQEDILQYQESRDRNIIEFSQAQKNIPPKKPRALSYSELIDVDARPACLLRDEMIRISLMLHIKTEEALIDKLTCQTTILEQHRPLLICDEELANLRSECEVAMNNESEKYDREVKIYIETLNAISLKKQNLLESSVEIKKINTLDAMHARAEYKKMLRITKAKLDVAEKQLPLACGEFMLCKPKSLKRLYKQIGELRAHRQLLQSDNLLQIKLQVGEYLDKKIVSLQDKMQKCKKPVLNRQYEDKFLRAHFMMKCAIHSQCYRVTKDYMIALHAAYRQLVLHAQQCASLHRKPKVLDALQKLKPELEKFYYLQNGKLRLPFAYYLKNPAELEKVQLPEVAPLRATSATRLPRA